MKKRTTAEKLKHYSSRVRRGDGITLSDKTGYSQSHISNVLNKRRSCPVELANAMYSISAKRAVIA